MTLPKLYGVIGWPIKHSLSSAMHNAAFKALGINAEYKLFEVPPEKLEDFILKRKDVTGFNITVPHKIRAKDINVLVIGCGGAGRAIIAALSWKDIGINNIYVYEINKAQVDSIKEHFL